MSTLKNLRTQLGLTANELAELIGCTRVLLAQAEIGHRKLPLSSQTAVTQIKIALNALETATPPPNATNTPKTNALVKKQLKQLSLQLKATELKIEKLQQSLQQTLLRQQLAQRFQQQPFLEDDGIAPLRMKIILQSANRQIDELSADMLKQQLALVSLQAQIIMINEFNFV